MEETARRDVTRAVIAMALVGGVLLLWGALGRLRGVDSGGALQLGAAFFLATPLARNLVVLVRLHERAPRLLAVAGTVALLVLYGLAARS